MMMLMTLISNYDDHDDFDFNYDDQDDDHKIDDDPHDSHHGGDQG